MATAVSSTEIDKGFLVDFELLVSEISENGALRLLAVVFAVLDDAAVFSEAFLA